MHVTHTHGPRATGAAIATGATDNGAGSAAMMEAMRILEETG